MTLDKAENYHADRDILVNNGEIYNINTEKNSDQSSELIDAIERFLKEGDFMNASNVIKELKILEKIKYSKYFLEKIRSGSLDITSEVSTNFIIPQYINRYLTWQDLFQHQNRWFYEHSDSQRLLNIINDVRVREFLYPCEKNGNIKNYDLKYIFSFLCEELPEINTNLFIDNSNTRVLSNIKFFLEFFKCYNYGRIFKFFKIDNIENKIKIFHQNIFDSLKEFFHDELKVQKILTNKNPLDVIKLKIFKLINKEYLDINKGKNLYCMTDQDICSAIQEWIASQEKIIA